MTTSMYCKQMITVIALTIPLICSANDTLPCSESAGANADLQITQTRDSLEQQRDTRRGNRSQRGKGGTLVGRGDIADLNIIQSGSSFEHQLDARRGNRSQRGKGDTLVGRGDIAEIITLTSKTNNRCTEGKGLSRRGCRS